MVSLWLLTRNCNDTPDRPQPKKSGWNTHKETEWQVSCQVKQCQVWEMTNTESWLTLKHVGRCNNRNMATQINCFYNTTGLLQCRDNNHGAWPSSEKGSTVLVTVCCTCHYIHVINRKLRSTTEAWKDNKLHARRYRRRSMITRF